MTSRSNRMSCAGGEFLYMSHSCVTWPVPSFASGSATHREVTTFQLKLHNTNDEFPVVCHGATQWPRALILLHLTFTVDARYIAYQKHNTELATELKLNSEYMLPSSPGLREAAMA